MFNVLRFTLLEALLNKVFLTCENGTSLYSFNSDSDNAVTPTRSVYPTVFCFLFCCLSVFLTLAGKLYLRLCLNYMIKFCISF